MDSNEPEHNMMPADSHDGHDHGGSEDGNPDHDDHRLPDSYSVQLPVEGMNCAACVARVEKAIEAVPGVLEVGVNLAIERTRVGYNPHRTATGPIVAAIESAGYRVPTTTASFPVMGMDCANCAMRVGRVVERMPGVTEATVNFAT